GGRMRFIRTLTVCAIILLAGCASPFTPSAPPEEPARVAKPAPPPTPEQVNDALTQLNKVFQEEYEKVLDQRGSRSDVAPRATAFAALEASLRRLGMIVE